MVWQAVVTDPNQDVVVIGAGAAGLMTAIAARRANPRLGVLVLDGARMPGAKILVSGGSRCNVTNAVVTAADFNGGTPGAIRRVLGALPVADTIAFFRELGVVLHEEPGGKLFPDSNRSRDVLDGLLKGIAAADASLRPGHRVLDVTARTGGFDVATTAGTIAARSVVIATGGLALPKSGSDGAGYTLARRFGHTIVPTTPALAPLVVGAPDERGWLRSLMGVSHPARLHIRANGVVTRAVSGSLLWTHFGISGPAALDASRHWLRAKLDGQEATMSVNVLPGERFETLEASWLAETRRRPKATVAHLSGSLLPGSVGTVLAERLGIRPATVLADLTRESRRAFIHHLLDGSLPVTDSRGYAYAEATAGGVPLAEINPATMESRRAPGLYFVGEVLDVDGRLGGFNFQWAWSSGTVAGRALGRLATSV